MSGVVTIIPTVISRSIFLKLNFNIIDPRVTIAMQSASKMIYTGLIKDKRNAEIARMMVFLVNDFDWLFLEKI
jgi:hypothetical protein